MIYRFWLHPWYLLAIVLSVLLWYTDSDYSFGILWPLCCLFFYDIQILITSLVCCGHCVVCSSMIYRFWLHPWYIFVIVLSVLLWYTDSDYTLGIICPLCCLFLYDIQIMITPLVYFGHSVVCSSMIYRFWLHPWYLLTIVFSVLLWYPYSDYPLGIFWPLCCLFFYDIQILITRLISFGHCAVCSSIIYRFCLHPWYLLNTVLSVLLWYTDSDYPLVSFGHCVVCSSMIYRIWLRSCYLLAIVLSVLLWYTDSDYTLGIFCPFCCLFLYNIQILITRLLSFGHCVVCSSMIYRFWVHPWYLLAIVFSVLLWYTDSDYPLGIFWPLCCLFFYDIQILITPLVSFGHSVFCSSMIYRFSLPPWFLLAIVLSVLLWYTDSEYPLGIFWHCVVCSSMIYRFWLHPWYLLAIVVSVLLWYTDSDYTLGIFWPLCCLILYNIQIPITPLVSFDHCVVCSAMIYRFWLPLGIFWPLCCLFFYDIQILITPLVSFVHCVVCSSMIYRFWLPPWYLLALCCLFFYEHNGQKIPSG